MVAIISYYFIFVLIKTYYMKHILLAAALLVGVSAFAQKEKKEKKEKGGAEEKFLYKDATFETDDYKLYIVDAVSTDGYTKFKMKIFNKTNDYLLVKPAEMEYSSDAKTATNTEKGLVIGPNDEDYRVVDFKGTAMKNDKFTVLLKGIYKASAGGKILEAADFDLPPTKNEFEAGGFACTLKKHDANTDKAVAKFECAYKGDGVGIINPYKCAAIMPNKTENANSKKNKAKVLERGQSDDFTVQFDEVIGAGDLQKKAIKIKWNETFRESKLVALSVSKIDIEKDQAKMDEKKKK